MITNEKTKTIKIHDVSDTALWVAAYRAEESEREDAVFKDKLAKKLAGTRGYEIMSSTPHKKAMAFAIVVRTIAIDRLIKMAIGYGVDTVINLGAGLDTRPYRMKLPDNLRWIEVDFPNTIAYKNEQLSDEKPSCNLQRIAADLSLDDERNRLFAQLGAETSKALIITEGVIAYLTNEQAAKLSRNLYEIPSFRFWVQDYSQGKLRKHKQSRDMEKKTLVNAPFQFNEKNPLKFFAQDGWKVRENIYILDEADRIGRPLPLMFPWSLLMRLFPQKIRTLGNKTYGYVLYDKPSIQKKQDKKFV